MKNELPFNGHRGKKCEHGLCKVRQTKNGQFSITIPSSIAKSKNLHKGDKIRFIDEGLWVKIEVNKNIA